MEGLWVHGVLLILLLPCPAGSQTQSSSIPDQRWWTDPKDASTQHQAARASQEQKADSAQEGLPPQPRCVRCCPPADKRFYPQPMPQINMTILKGE
ncbi:C1QT1 protein, partial [Atrichornis clamosus]|nr:C1QT1 protein [Atrichornis clamosus]